MMLSQPSFSNATRCLVAAAACATACDEPEPSPGPGDDSADDASQLFDDLAPEFSSQLRVPLERSPAHGGEFALCDRPQRDEFNMTTAAWLSFVAVDVYSPLPLLEAALDELGFDAEGLSGDGTKAIWAHHPAKNIVIIGFRGTEPLSIRDLLTNVAAVPDDLDDEPGFGKGWGKVHGGFLHAFQTAPIDQLLDRLHQLDGTDTRIFITGHSLGGSLAILLASRILADMDAGARYNLAGVYTFGAPRIGSSEFVDRVTEAAARHQVAIVRVRQGRDVITKVPGSYKHVGKLVHIDRSQFSILRDDEPPYLPIPSASDHRSQSYYAKLIEGLDGRLTEAQWLDCAVSAR